MAEFRTAGRRFYTRCSPELRRLPEDGSARAPPLPPTRSRMRTSVEESQVRLIDELDARQEEVLSELDALLERIESLLAEHNASRTAGPPALGED